MTINKDFEKWAIEKYGVRIKETDIKWWEERQEIWNACATWHADIQATSLRELESKVNFNEIPKMGGKELQLSTAILLIQELQAENRKVREQLITQIRKWAFGKIKDGEDDATIKVSELANFLYDIELLEDDKK